MLFRQLKSVAQAFYALFADSGFAMAGAVAYSFVLSFLIAKLIDITWGLRVSRDVELEGLDINLHAESAYDTGGSSAHTAPHTTDAAITSEKVNS